jgi:hypothetical protein
MIVVCCDCDCDFDFDCDCDGIEFRVCMNIFDGSELVKFVFLFCLFFGGASVAVEMGHYRMQKQTIYMHPYVYIYIYIQSKHSNVVPVVCFVKYVV